MHAAIDPLISRSKNNHSINTGFLHYHDTYELYYMCEGETTYLIADEIFSIEKGNFVFVPRGIMHNTDYKNCSRNDRFLISFPEDILSPEIHPLLEELGTSRVIYIPDNHLPDLEELMRKMELEYKNGNSRSLMMVHIYIMELLVLLCRYKAERKPHIHESDKIIYTISEYISTHFDRDLALDTLCVTFAISKSYLSRKFKAVTGIGIHNYITYVRMANAEKLLRETDLSISEIARRCGYNDSSYFALVFKNIRGVTPFQFSRRM